MINVLVTGSEGFIGKHLVSLLGDCYKIDLLLGSDICESLPDIDFTHIFHLAALRSVPHSQSSPEEYIRTNVWGTYNLLRKYPNARIMNVSSSAVNQIKSVYGASKKSAEAFSLLHENVITVRPYNVFGEGQTYESGAVIPRFIHAMLHKYPVTIYGDGEQQRDFTYVKDIVKAMYDLMFNENVGPRCIFDLGYSNPVSVNSILNSISEELNVTPEVRFEPKREFDIEYSSSPFEIKQQYGREIGLSNTVDWWKNEYSKA